MTDSQEINEQNVEKTYTDPVTGKFVKGNPGGGRPQGSVSLIQLMKNKLAQMGPDGKRAMAEHLIDNILQDALDYDGQSRKHVLNYLEGMPKETKEHEIKFPVPFDDIQENNSLQENKTTEE